MKEWLDRLKEQFIHLNKRIDSLYTSEKMGPFRIAGSVIWNISLLFIIFLTVAFIFVGGLGLGYFASLVYDDPLMTKEEMKEQIFSYEETSEIYFANNIYIGKLRTDLERRETSINSVSPLLINAVLATEDEYFREHNGIVPKAILRGLLQDVTNSSTQTGGSTLTQQLIKNQILTNEVSYERKAREILLALRLEHFMSKEEILEAYLNIIPYGRNSSGKNIAGVETAAQGIFGISASELTLAQAAYIAGIPQAPFAYTPFTNKGVLKAAEDLQPGIERMNTVLTRMLEVGYITQAQYKEATNYDITKDFREPETEATDKYPWLTYELEYRAKEIIAKVLAEKDGIDPERLKEEKNLKEKYMILADRNVRSGGYRIYSTIDKEIYDSMQKAAKGFKNYGHTFIGTEIDEDTKEKVEKEYPVEVGSIVIDNGTGKILSFVGGRNFNISELNHATQASRPNGSTMKPLLVYAPAIEYGVIGAGSPVVDVKFTIQSQGQNYSPSNYNENEERGIISAREALADSLNLPALRLYNSILDRRPATYLDKMGISNLAGVDYENLATSIGGITNGTTVEENTNAFTTFANGGQFIDAYMIEKIEDLDGNLIYEHESKPVQVFSPETSYIVTDMLRDVLNVGTGTRAKSMLKFSSDFAAKTGTTQKYNDVWLVGYNPNITLGVWLGYDQPQTLYQFNNTYGQPSVRINMLWANLMNSVYDANKKVVIGNGQGFKAPSGVVNLAFCGISGDAVTDACNEAGMVRSDLFNRNVFVPSKKDDSFISSSSVLIDGKAYLALDSTPKEFVTAGKVGLNPDFAKRMLGRLGGDASKLLPEGKDNVVATDTFKADGNPPAAVKIKLKDNNVTWSKSTSKDVIGYRVYDISNGNRYVAKTVKDGEDLHATIQDGQTFVVVAVDITGKESPHSNSVEKKSKEAGKKPNNEDDKDKEGNKDPNNQTGRGNTNQPPGGNGQGNSDNGNSSGTDPNNVDSDNTSPEDHQENGNGQ